MSAAAAKVLAWWLGDIYGPVSPVRPSRAPEYAAFFAKVARRRRVAGDFVILMARTDAELLARVLRSAHLVAEKGGTRFWLPVPWNIRKIGDRFDEALRPVGRPRLSRPEIEVRALEDLAVEERHRRRVKRVFRYERAKELFDAEGKTFLGALGEWPDF